MFKRIIAGILSAVIVFSSFSPAVNAVEITETVQEEVVEEASTEEPVEENVEEKAVEELEIESEPETESEQEVKLEVFVVEEEITEVIEYATGTEGEKTVVEEGTCGENITWVFYDDGELVISGTGAMDIGEDCYIYPWDEYTDQIITIVIESGITTIGESAFTGFDNLKNITIPSSILMIDNYAFEACDSIENIVLPEGVEAIGKTVFGRCKALKTVTIPTTIISIGSYAFQNTDSLETAFYNGTWEEWKTIVSSLEGNIYLSDSKVCTKQNYTYQDNGDGTATITGAGEGGLGGKIQIPEEIDGLKVTSIGEKAFMDNTTISSVEIPDSIEKIEKMAFYRCELLDVVFGSGLKDIADYAFYEATSENHSINDYKFELPEGLESIGKYAFAGLFYSLEIIIPGTVNSVGSDAFANSNYRITFCGDAQKWIDIHKTDSSNMPPISNVTFTGDGQAFILYKDSDGNSNSYQLVTWKDAEGDITIPDTFRGLPVTNIRESAFKNNTTITSVEVPKSVTRIRNTAFSGCSNLKSVDIKAEIQSLEYELFSDCINLECIKIPFTVNQIHSDVFSQCVSLKDIYFDSEYNWKNLDIKAGNSALEDTAMHFETDWGYRIEWFGEDNLENVNITILGKTQIPENFVIPDEINGITVTAIGDSAFKNCTNISTVEFPETLNTIDNYAFEGAVNLKSVKIPDNIEWLGAHAFKGCTGLEKVAFANNYTGTTGCHLFSGCTKINEIAMSMDGIHSWTNAEACGAMEWEDLEESIFEGVPRNAKVKVVKDSWGYRFMEALGFTNMTVSIVLREITLPKSLSVELGKTKTVSVTKVPTNANDTLNLVWTSADESVATVDENGVITGKNLGATQITVKDLNSGKTAKTTVQVVLPATSKITTKMSPAIDSLGLQSGQSVTMQIFATGIENDEAMDPSFFTFTSSDDSIVTVDENGVIRSVYNGTKAISVKITAKLNNDPNGRKVYVSVKTIPVQTEELQYYVSDDVELTDGTVVIPKLKVAESDFSFGIYAQPMNSAGELVNTSLKWTSSNTKVATVAADGMVTVKKNADGIARITATANDLKKATTTVNIDVRDYSPRLASNTVTLNTNTYEEALVQIYPVYETRVKSVRLEGNECLYADYKEDNGNHAIIVGATDVLKKGTYKLNLIAEIEGKGEYVQNFTVKVANSVPKVTVKQTAAFNLFYSDTEVMVNVTAKNAVVTNAEIVDTGTFKSEFDDANSALTLIYDDPTSVLDKKATIIIELEGYRDPIQKAFNVNAKEVKPVLTQSRTSTKLSSLSTVGVPMEITNKSTKEIINWNEDSIDVSVYKSSADYAYVNYEGTQVTIYPILNSEFKFANGKTSHAAKLEIQGETWLKPIVISHTISINSKLPTIKAKNTTLTLNSLFGNEVQTEIVPSLSNCPTPVEYEVTAVNESVKDKLIVDATGWTLTAKFADIEDMPAKGSYKYNVIATIEGEEIKTTVTIKVAESTPKVTLGKTTVSLNKTVADYIEFAANIASGYQIVDMNVSNAAGNELTTEQLSVEYNADTKMITARVKDETIVNKTYKYLLTPFVKVDNSEIEVELKPITLSVKVHSNKISMTTSAKGNIDLVTRDTGIIYTITGGKNFNYHLDDILVDEIKLLGDSAELFDIEVLEPNEKGQPQLMVKAKADSVLSTSAAYKYKLLVKVDGFEKEIETAEFKVKTKQTKLSLQASGNLNIYQSVKNGEIRIELTKPVDAKIQNMQILSTKATTVPEGALDYQIIKNEDGTYVLKYTVEYPEKLKVNAGYKLSFSVTPEGNALNKPAQTFTITLKVKR